MAHVGRLFVKNLRLLFPEQRKRHLHAQQLKKALQPKQLHYDPRLLYFTNFSHLETTFNQYLNLHQQQIDALPIITTLAQASSKTNENQVKTIQYQANNLIEDRIISTTLRKIPAQFVSVFDGHGGDLFADYCQKNIVQIVDSFVQENQQQPMYQYDIDLLICDSLRQAYRQLEEKFYQQVYTEMTALNSKKIRNVGTCGLTVVVYGKKIYVANCGDSEAIVVTKQKNKQEIRYMELNQRFSVSNPAERERLIKQFPEDPDIVVQEQGGSYYVKGRLQPTKSLGDYHLKKKNLYKGKGQFNGPYITAEPQIKVFPIEDHYLSIVLASDGVWDFIDKDSVAEACLESDPHESILNKTLEKIAGLHKKSVEEIKNLPSEVKRSFHDDISIGVVSLRQANQTSAIF